MLYDKVYSDERRLTQIINNLLSNAIKFTESGAITIKMKLVEINNEKVLKFSVRDTGVGIKEDDLPKLC